MVSVEAANIVAAGAEGGIQAGGGRGVKPGARQNVHGDDMRPSPGGILVWHWQKTKL